METVSAGPDLTGFLAGYEGGPSAWSPQCFFLLTFGSPLPGFEPSQNPGCLDSGSNEAQLLMSHRKNPNRDTTR